VAHAEHNVAFAPPLEGNLVKDPPSKEASCTLFHAAPLLEKELYAAGLALGLDVDDPRL